MTWIQTYTGRRFNLLEPQADDIAFEDIAHALSQICRFTGHTRCHWSVAQHSLVVSCLVGLRSPDCLPAEQGRQQLAALLHDAAKAYIGDISKPLKLLLAAGGCITAIERRIEQVIEQAFNLEISSELRALIKRADDDALIFEAARYLPGGPSEAWLAAAGLEVLPAPPPQIEQFLFPEQPERVEQRFCRMFRQMRSLANTV